LVNRVGIHAITLTACSAMSTVSLGLKFGGQLYTFTGVDLILDDVSNTPGLVGMCLSSLFVLGSVLDNQIIGASGPAWLVGDSFLKNVYSVYRSVDVPFIHITLAYSNPSQI
jgi:hypothetical protein